MATQKEWLVQGMENDVIFYDADFHDKTEARDAARKVKEAHPAAIVAVYRLWGEL